LIVVCVKIPSNDQSHRQNQQKRHQIFTYLKKQATSSSEKLKQVTLSYDKQMGFWADSGAGNIVGLSAANGTIFVPHGYVSGTALGISTATWNNVTITSLGLTPGSYVFFLTFHPP
jgi:hypothetical protein